MCAHESRGYAFFTFSSFSLFFVLFYLFFFFVFLFHFSFFLFFSFLFYFFFLLFPFFFLIKKLKMDFFPLKTFLKCLAGNLRNIFFCRNWSQNTPTFEILIFVFQKMPDFEISSWIFFHLKKFLIFFSEIR